VIKVYDGFADSSSSSREISSDLAAPKGPLGIYAKSHSALIRINNLERVDPDTGELLSFAEDPAQNALNSRLERWALLSVARELLPKTRTAKCYRVRRAEVVSVLYSESAKSAHLGGLCTCSSVWVCPVCAAKITERRREDLQAGIDAAKLQGLHPYLLTLTHPHGRTDALADLLSGEQDAMARFLKTRATRKALSLIGWVGHVRAWECTHGRKRDISNGWHPHFHFLVLCDRVLSCDDRQAAVDALFVEWRKACVRAGLQAPGLRHGVRLDGGERAVEYVAKFGLESDGQQTWGLAAELTKSHVKRACKGETPFDLLRAVFADDADREARWLFKEYAGAFRGKRQLVWSRGLRELLGLDEDATDEEIAAEQREDAVLLAGLFPSDWRKVARLNAQGELLELARRKDSELLARFVRGLPG
jgi:hypothetical protein